MLKRIKYDYAFRLRCVEAALSGKDSIKGIAKRNGFDESNLRLWIGFYEHYGKAGLISRVNRRYDLSFKLDVLASIDTEHLSLRSACVRFNIASESVIINWQKAYKLNGLQGLLPKVKGRPKMDKLPIKRKPRKTAKPLTKEEELLKENEYLRAENELLKKLQALVQTNKKQKP
jgi:transposase